jgi:hypothetical protein
MAALRRAVQRGEPLDAQAMMLLEMFSPAPAPEPRAVRAPRTAAVAKPAPKPLAEPLPPAPVLPHVAPRERRPSMVLSPEQFT